MAALLGSLAGVGVGSTVAYSFRNGPCDGLVTLRYIFDGGGWTQQRMTWFAAGADDWDSIYDPIGGLLVGSTTVNGNIDVRIRNLGEGGGGKVKCPFGDLWNIKIDPDTLSHNEFIAVSSHEVGHAHGLARTGPPTASTSTPQQ